MALGQGLRLSEVQLPSGVPVKGLRQDRADQSRHRDREVIVDLAGEETVYLCCSEVDQIPTPNNRDDVESRRRALARWGAGRDLVSHDVIELTINQLAHGHEGVGSRESEDLRPHSDGGRQVSSPPQHEFKR